MTRDEVIKALSLCRYDPDPGQESKQLVSCDACPYWSDKMGCRMTDLFTDAIAMLKQDSADLVDGIQAMREICWMHVCDDCPAAVGDSASCAFFPDHDDLSPQEVAEIIWAYQAKKRKEEKADG